MRSLDDAALDPPERVAIDAMLAEDPALADELEAIAGHLDPAAGRTFWRELAREGARHHRPVAAVLKALERAAAA